MNILLISSSPRKERSRTFMLAEEVIKGLGSPAKTEVIHLFDCKIGFCRHCEGCHKKILKCPIKDDAATILKKMLDAEGIILASPNYINQVTASMKAILDRSSHFIHCKRFLGKYVAGVVSSGSGQDNEVLGYIKYYSNTCGAQYAGGVSFFDVPISKEKKGEAFDLGRSLAAAIKEKRSFPEQAEAIRSAKEHFRKIMENRKDEWSEEYQYWKDKGWL